MFRELFGGNSKPESNPNQNLKALQNYLQQAEKTLAEHTKKLGNLKEEKQKAIAEMKPESEYTFPEIIKLQDSFIKLNEDIASEEGLINFYTEQVNQYEAQIEQVQQQK